MKITADTNLLVRAIIKDEPRQAALAISALGDAEAVAITIPAFCELVWVLSHRYKIPSGRIADTVAALLETKNVIANRPVAQAGLAAIAAGADFADGVIAYEGSKLGGEVFVSFDRRAVKALSARNVKAQLLGG